MSHCQGRIKVMLFAVHFTVKDVYQLYITTKVKRFSFKSGHVMWVVKLIKEYWPIVLVLQ